MSISRIRPTAVAHALVAAVVRPGDTAVDATAGNGHDTLFLARLAGPSGRVIAFDVQPAAIESTRRRLAGHPGIANVDLHLASHAGISRHAPPGLAAVMFNLGYLPGADHHLTTSAATTIPALAAAARLVRQGGVITIVAYPGHPGGANETAAVLKWCQALDPATWSVLVIKHRHTPHPAPVLVALRRQAKADGLSAPLSLRHLGAAFPADACPLAAFQRVLQVAVTG